MTYPTAKERRDALIQLQEFVRQLTFDKVTTVKQFNEWKKTHNEELELYFGYKQIGDMPAMSALISADFHPTLPLICLNYSPVAHNVLHSYPDGWTTALRFCRGLVLDKFGRIVAVPFMKFFNQGENPETQLDKMLLKSLFTATKKHDGHLGIIFKYQDQLILTTRGRFMSPTSILGNKMLHDYAEKYDWNKTIYEGMTFLVEIIHPATKVFLEYSGLEKFILLGVMSLTENRLHDYKEKDVELFAQDLHIESAECWCGDDLNNLIAHMRDRSIKNQEGYVIRFEDGMRVKMKFETYIGMMVADKLSYSYIMNRMASGNLEKMLATLPEELFDLVLGMIGRITMKLSVKGDAKAKWRNLYALYELEKTDSKTGEKITETSFRNNCRNMVKSFFNIETSKKEKHDE